MILDTEMFSDGREQYFFDIKKAANQRMFLVITNQRSGGDPRFRRNHIVLFEENLPFFVEALSMLLGRLASGNLGASC